MRLFAGLRPGDAAIAELAGFTSRLRLGPAAATSRDTWHLTLAFIGELDDRRLPDVTAALTETSRGVAPFELRLTGGLVLGRTTSVLCVGVDGDRTALDDLVTETRAGLKRFAVPFDDRPYRPHLTLARAKSPAVELSASTMLLDDFHGGPWTATEVTLYRSRMGPPVSYETVATFPLAG